MIYLFQSGAPSQMDLFDDKPRLKALRGTELPDSIRKGQRLTGMTSRQESFPVAPSKFAFARHGKCRQSLSELLPHLAAVADELCFDPLDAHRGDQSRPGGDLLPDRRPAGRPAQHRLLALLRPGHVNSNLPAFVVMLSQGSGNPNDQPLYDRLWGSGFLPTRYQGVKFRSVGEPVLYPVQSRGRRPTRPAGGCSTTWPGSTR